VGGYHHNPNQLIHGDGGCLPRMTLLPKSANF